MNEKIHKKKCICGKLISKRSTFCKSCAQLGERNHFFEKSHSDKTRETIGYRASERLKDPSKNPNWKGGVTFVKKPCPICDREILRTSRFCQSCWGTMIRGELNPSKRLDSRAKISQGLIGDKNGSWGGGVSKLIYGFDFTKELKGKIKTRDRNLCALCDDNQNLVIHHINYDKKNNESKNLLTVCRSCNARLNFNRDYFVKYLNDRCSLRLLMGV